MDEQPVRESHIQITYDHYFEQYRWIAYLGPRERFLARRYGFDPDKGTARECAMKAFDGPEYRDLRAKLMEPLGAGRPPEGASTKYPSHQESDGAYEGQD